MAAAMQQQQATHEPRRTPKRSKSTRMKQPNLPTLKRASSLENLCTGTLIKEVPEDFLVHFDPKTVSGQVMDLDGILRKNGANSALVRNLEGKVNPSAHAKRRMSYKMRNAHSVSPERNPGEEVDSGKQKDITPTAVTQTTISINVQVEDSTVGGVTSTHTNTLIDVVKSSTVLRDSAISTDSGIGNDIATTTHGVPTENSPTDSTTCDRLPLPPPQTRASRLLTERVSKDRPDSMLSQLCVMSVALPANIQEGQKGKGAILKFRFSPHTLIETLRVAILKVRSHAAITVWYVGLHVYYNWFFFSFFSNFTSVMI